MVNLFSKRKVPLLTVLLFLTVAAVFLPALRNDFISYDDQSYVVQNPYVQGGLTLASVSWAFRSFSQANWHPLTWLSHMLDCQLFGLAPGGHHATSVLLHTLNSVLLFLLLEKLTAAPWRSLFVAALFGLHPLHVESVAWIAERKDVLSGLFFLLTLWAYGHYLQSPRSKVQRARSKHQNPNITGSPASAAPHAARYYALALLFFALGLMSKPMLVTVPLILVLLDFWPWQRLSTDWRRALVEKVPFLLLSAASSAVTFAAQQSGKTVTALAGLPLSARVANALVSYGRYLGKLMWPSNLAVFYPHPGHWPLTIVIPATLLLILVSAIAWLLRRSRPYLLTGWSWYLGMLVPVVGLVQVGWQSIADRYSYLPLIGMFILLAWTAHDLGARWRPSRILLPVLGGVVVLVCAAFTHRQLGYWKDSGALFRHAIAVTGNNYVSCANLGNYAAASGDLDEAVKQYREVVRLGPDAQAHCNLGAVLYRKGLVDEALGHFEQALSLDANYVDARVGAGTALAGKGRLEEARQELAEALRLNPNSAPAHVALGYLLAGTGQRVEAINHFRQALELQPNFPGVREQLQVMTANGNGH
ncbi:MAG TPA: tetratricopeptide repeat protein [Candidatus Binatia bacterium]|nr:tetratricopeptide repeat protein [Candidatus Binatia bacterium]